MEAEARGRGGRFRFWQWVRHHMTALLTTVVDFSTMVSCVELLHISPVKAVVVSATFGAITNFLINRRFTYRAWGSGASRQAVRFVMVSGTSLVLNALGEHLLHNVAGIQYIVARVMTAVVVSNGWNYPMLRFFVFSGESPKQT